MSTSLFKRLAIAILLATGSYSFAQCSAAFTYTISSNGVVNFTNTSSSGGFMTTYFWDFGDQVTDNSTNPTHGYSFNGTYVVSLTIMDSSVLCNNTYTASVAITNAPNNFTCQAGYTYGYGSGGTVNFTNTSTTSLSSYSYNWSFGDNSNSTSASPSHTYAYNGSYYVTVQILDSLGNGLCSYAQYVTVSNGTPCNLQASFTWVDVGGGQINFTNTSSNAAPTVVYTWTFGDGASSTQTSPSHTYQFSGPYTVQLSASDSLGGCGHQTMDSINVSSGTTPPSCNATVTYTLGSTGLVSFSASAAGTLTNPQYSWSFGDGGSSAALNPSYTYQYNGTYYFSFTAQDGTNPQYGCNYSGQVTITNTATNPNSCGDSAYFSLSQDTTQASTWVVTLASTGLSSAVSATWSWGDGTSSTGLSPSHTYSAAGWYTICVNVAFACGDSSSFCQTDSLYRNSGQMVGVYVVNTITGIQNNTQAVTSLKAFPNPFADELKLVFNSNESKSMAYALYDVMGKEVLKDKLSVTQGENQLKLNTANIGKGVYFLSLTDGMKAVTIKVVK